MTIFLIRHGRSAGNEKPPLYGEVGDNSIWLTDEGWRQAIAAGEFSVSCWQEMGLRDWPRIHYSSMLRTQQTTRGFLEGIKRAGGDNVFPGEPRAFMNPDLMEQHLGVEAYLHADLNNPDLPEEQRRLSAMLLEFGRKSHNHNPHAAHPPFGESPQMMIQRGTQVIDTLCRDMAKGVENHVLITHGNMIKGLIMRLYHLPPSSWEKLRTPANTDIYKIDFDSSKPSSRAGEIRQIWDGKNGCRVNNNPIAGLGPATIDDLPPLPAHLRLSPDDS